MCPWTPTNQVRWNELASAVLFFFSPFLRANFVPDESSREHGVGHLESGPRCAHGIRQTMYAGKNWSSACFQTREADGARFLLFVVSRWGKGGSWLLLYCCL